ncbi:amphi-Trp domain-containing protein [Balneolales bacterium ANBcel1]|nr:amphi-Trp domain-containing protein [Balneolales bacterium ANBcel1]
MQIFKSKELKTRQEAADFLHQLAEKVAGGKVQIMQNTEEVFLNLPEEVILEVEVKNKEKGRRGMQQKLELEIKWYEGGQGYGPTEIR